MRAEGNRFFVGLDLEALFEIKILELAIYGRQKIFENSCHRVSVQRPSEILLSLMRYASRLSSVQR